MATISTMKATRTKGGEPPDDLGEPERQIWRTLRAQYEIDDAPSLLLLAQLTRNLMLVRECSAQIAADGRVTKAGREHPLLRTLVAAEKLIAQSLRALNFDVAPTRPGPGRPPGGGFPR